MSHALSLEQLKELLHYDPDTGVFTWKKHRLAHFVGRPAGSRAGVGHLQVSINNRLYYLHRLAFLYVTGVMPEGVVDHVNRDPSDNRFINLRVVDTKTNSRNRGRASKNNGTGLLGVSYFSNAKKWGARIYADGVSTFLGLFDSPTEAHNAYLLAKRQIHERKNT